MDAFQGSLIGVLKSLGIVERFFKYLSYYLSCVVFFEYDNIKIED
jgi:hypothetical protein